MSSSGVVNAINLGIGLGSCRAVGIYPESRVQTSQKWAPLAVLVSTVMSGGWGGQNCDLEELQSLADLHSCKLRLLYVSWERLRHMLGPYCSRVGKILGEGNDTL